MFPFSLSLHDQFAFNISLNFRSFFVSHALENFDRKERKGKSWAAKERNSCPLRLALGQLTLLCSSTNSRLRRIIFQMKKRNIGFKEKTKHFSISKFPHPVLCFILFLRHFYHLLLHNQNKKHPPITHPTHQTKRYCQFEILVCPPRFIGASTIKFYIKVRQEFLTNDDTLPNPTPYGTGQIALVKNRIINELHPLPAGRQA